LVLLAYRLARPAARLIALRLNPLRN